MRMPRPVYALVLALALPLAASATTLAPMSVETMTQSATMVVEARALQSWSQWEQREHLIYTYTRLQVTKTLKGTAPAYVIVRQMGGSADGYTQIVSGVRHFSAGEQSVLFLRPSVAGNGVNAIVGFVQGNFRVLEKAGAEPEVTNGVAGVSTYTAGTGAMTAFTGSKMRLSELEARVARVQR
jgi:hypothetical protein